MSATPHTCPKCEGTRKVPDPRTGEMGDCPTCAGAGVVWEGLTEAAGGEDARPLLDLTGS